MLCHSSRLLSLLFAVAVAAKPHYSPKPSFHYGTSIVTGSSYPTNTVTSYPSNSVSSYGTIPYVSATNRSVELSKTVKYPHSKSSTGAAVFSTGTVPHSTKSVKYSYTPTGSVYSTKPSYTPTGSVYSTKSVKYSYTPTGSFNSTKHSYTPTGSVYSTKPSYAPTGSIHTKNSTATPPPTTLTTLPSTSSTTSPTGTPTSFKIKITLAFDYPNAPPIDGDYVVLVPGAGTDETAADIMELTADASQASIFTLNADGTLQSGDLIASLPAGAAYHNLLFQTEATITSGGDYKTSCTIAGDGLSCATNTGSYYTDDVYFTCDNGPYFIEAGPTGRPYQDFCFTLNFLVAPV